MVSSFLVICFESNAYRNIIKRVETARAVSFLCQRLSKTCYKVCDELSGDCKKNSFKTSAGHWKRRISSSWALPSRKKKKPQKPLKLWEASGLKEKGENMHILQMTCKGRAPLVRYLHGESTASSGSCLPRAHPLSPVRLAGELLAPQAEKAGRFRQ